MAPTLPLVAAILALAGLAVGFWWGRARTIRLTVPAPASPPPPSDPSREPEHDLSRLYALASQIFDFFQSSAHPADLLSDPGFREGVAQLRESRLSGSKLAGYFAGDNAIIACMAAQALRERGDLDGAEEILIDALGSVSPWSLYFALASLAETLPPEHPLAARTLTVAVAHLEGRHGRQFLTEFLQARAERGEAPRFGDELASLEPEQLAGLNRFLARLDPKLGPPLLEDLDRWQRQRIDRGFLTSVGRLWEPDDDISGDVVWHDALESQVDALVAELDAERRRSALLVGESGVGKTKLAHAVARALQKEGWLVFEAGASALIAG
jgi:hypothetical protein